MNLLIELLFPRRCPVCDKPVDKMGRYICKRCQNTLQYVQSPYCMKCGKSLNEDTKEYCEDCQSVGHVFERGRALYKYDSVKDAIYRFKYEGRREYADFFGKELVRRFGKQIKEWNADALVPVPLHAEREKKRGYNQATLIAKGLEKELNIPVNDKIIRRVKATLPQKQVNGKERQNNLKNAFKIGQNDVKLNTVVVVDDISWTCNTCALHAFDKFVVTRKAHIVDFARNSKDIFALLQGKFYCGVCATFQRCLAHK